MGLQVHTQGQDFTVIGGVACEAYQENIQRTRARHWQFGTYWRPDPQVGRVNFLRRKEILSRLRAVPAIRG